jgi:hypothetical protein
VELLASQEGFCCMEFVCMCVGVSVEYMSSVMIADVEYNGLQQWLRVIG